MNANGANKTQHYKEPKEYLFYKETMARVKKTNTHAENIDKTERPKQPREKGMKEKMKWVGKSLWQARQAMKQVMKARRYTHKHPYKHHLRSTALHEIRQYQKSTELLITRLSFLRLVREAAQEVKPDI